MQICANLCTLPGSTSCFNDLISFQAFQTSRVSVKKCLDCHEATLTMDCRLLLRVRDGCLHICNVGRSVLVPIVCQEISVCNSVYWLLLLISDLKHVPHGVC